MGEQFVGWSTWYSWDVVTVVGNRVLRKQTTSGDCSKTGRRGCNAGRCGSMLDLLSMRQGIQEEVLVSGKKGVPSKWPGLCK